MSHERKYQVRQRCLVQITRLVQISYLWCRPNILRSRMDNANWYGDANGRPWALCTLLGIDRWSPKTGSLVSPGSARLVAQSEWGPIRQSGSTPGPVVDVTSHAITVVSCRTLLLVILVKCKMRMYGKDSWSPKTGCLVSPQVISGCIDRLRLVGAALSHFPVSPVTRKKYVSWAQKKCLTRHWVAKMCFQVFLV